MLVSLTVGKVDAGVAVLLTEDKRLIEFPSILLPPDISTGSIVDVKVSRNQSAEIEANKAFDDLQSSILSTFGSHSPQTPVLRCRNATQTSVVLEWDPISLATAKLKSLSLYRNGAKAGVIPRPMEMTSTKISGLAVDTEYTFMLILRTSSGTYQSEKLTVRTHKMTDLSGITITPGVMAPELRASLQNTVEKVGARIIESVRIDTTHFVCTEGRGPGFEKAREMNIPVVLPDWIKGCEREGRLVGVRAYYLDANPKDRQIGQTILERKVSQQNVKSAPQAKTPERDTPQPPTTNVIPPTPDGKHQESEDEDEGEDEEEDEEEEEDGKVEKEAPASTDESVGNEKPVIAQDSESDADSNEDEKAEESENSADGSENAAAPSIETNGNFAKISVDSKQSDEAGTDEAHGRNDKEDKFDEVNL